MRVTVKFENDEEVEPRVGVFKVDDLTDDELSAVVRTSAVESGLREVERNPDLVLNASTISAMESEAGLVILSIIGFTDAMNRIAKYLPDDKEKRAYKSMLAMGIHSFGAGALEDADLVTFYKFMRFELGKRGIDAASIPDFTSEEVP